MSNDAESPEGDQTPHSETTAPSAATESLDCSFCSFESFEHHPDERAYRAMFDAEIVEPSTAVVGAVSTVAGNDPRDIEPLYSTIDPDALDALFDRRKTAEGDLQIRFTIDGYDVTLSSYGSVVVRPPNTDENADRDAEKGRGLGDTLNR